MEDKEFLDLMSELKNYLKANKVFVQNPARFAEFKHAREIAQELFVDMEITVKDDPLQMGALILCIEGYDISARGTREIELFQQLIAKADNFEIYSTDEGKIKFAILFGKVLIRTATDSLQ